MNITIRQVDAFLMVAELRSFTAAGAALHITQSAVSNLVKDLEDQIGVQLFDRGRRVVKLTAAGKIFFEKASRAQDVFRSMEQCATELHDARIHRVRIAAAPLLGCTLIPLLAYRFMRRYPEMRVELVDLPMSRVQQAVVDGSADLGYGPARDLEAGVTGELFFETSVHMLSLPQHPLAGEAVSWEQVRKADVIAVGRESIHYISADVAVRKTSMWRIRCTTWQRRSLWRPPARASRWPGVFPSCWPGASALWPPLSTRCSGAPCSCTGRHGRSSRPRRSSSSASRRNTPAATAWIPCPTIP